MVELHCTENRDSGPHPDEDVHLKLGQLKSESKLLQVRDVPLMRMEPWLPRASRWFSAYLFDSAAQ